VKALVAALLGAAVLVPYTSGTEASAGQAVISDGHVDIGPRFVNQDWTVQVRDDTTHPATWRDLDDVVLQASDASVLEIPDDPAFDFLGAPGERSWLLPQTQQPGILWPGWSTQDQRVATTIDGEVTWSLHDVQGPGHFTLFLNADFGEPEVLFDSQQPYPQSTDIEPDTHAHGNWAFSEPGSYLLDISMSTHTKNGQHVRDRGWLRLHVGDHDPEAAFEVTPTPSPTPDRPTSGHPSPQVSRSGGVAASEQSSWIAPAIVGVAGILALVGVSYLLLRKRRRHE
jgi:putative ABC transporter-associated repeat protein